jgi:hypothetical protein
VSDSAACPPDFPCRWLILSVVTLVIVAATPRPIDVDAVSVERARTFKGRLVVASFIVGKPAYSLRGFTMVGAADRDDGAERGAVLVGKRLDVEEGKRLTVVGKLLVIDHAADRVNGIHVPGWVEIRVEEVNRATKD